MTELVEISKLGLRKFDGTDFALWKYRIEIALSTANCKDAVVDGFETGTDKPKIEMENKSKGIIVSALTDRILRKIKKGTALEIWKSLIEKFETKDLAALNYNRLSFLNAKQKNTESVEEFTDRLSSLRDELEAAGHKLTDEDMILTIISGVSASFDTTIQCLTVDKKLSDVKVEVLIQKLISEDKRKNEIRGNNKSSVSY